MKRKDKIKEEIVTEYMAGDKTYRDLEARYGYGASTIFRWVKEEGRKKSLRGRKEPVSGEAVSRDRRAEDAEAEVKRLRAELKKAEMHTKVLNALIDIVEDEMGVDIRKKGGSGR